MEDCKESLSECRCELVQTCKRTIGQILPDSYQAILQDIRGILENICFEMCRLAEDVLEVDEDFTREKNASTEDDLVVKALKGQQIANSVVLLWDCYGKAQVLFCGRFSAVSFEILRGAVGLFDFSMKNALCVKWSYVNVWVYLRVGVKI